jgi:hypothetical protein
VLIDRTENAPPTPEELRALRGVEVLEGLATPEARQLLQALARGPGHAPLTHEAKTAVERLQRR